MKQTGEGVNKSAILQFLVGTPTLPSIPTGDWTKPLRAANPLGLLGATHFGSIPAQAGVQGPVDDVRAFMCLSVKSADSGMCSGAHTDVLCVCTYLCRHIETKHWRDELHRTSTRWPLGNDEPVLFFSEFLHRESVGATGWWVGKAELSCPRAHACHQPRSSTGAWAPYELWTQLLRELVCGCRYIDFCPLGALTILPLLQTPSL